MSLNLTKLHVLLVDDSGFMRIVLQDILCSYPDIQVVDTASDGKEALEKCLQYKPQVVLLDLTMKDYDGLYAIKEIMKSCPTPIVILSSLRSSDPSAVIEALNAGAVDYIDKPTGIGNAKIRDIGDKIVSKLKLAANTKGVLNTVDTKHKNQFEHTFEQDSHYKAVVIGSSTGGTGAIEYILMHLPQNFPMPIIIAQHMPPEFIHSFAKRLDQLNELKVSVAELGQEVIPGRIYLLPGDTNTILERKSSTARVRFAATEQTFAEYNHPSVDGLFMSAADVYKNQLIMVLLTGMGKDGAAGLLRGFRQGALTITQDQESSVVYGMPRAGVELGASKYSIHLKDIASFIVSAVA